MILIIGGAFQGKTQFANELLEVKGMKEKVSGRTDSYEAAFEACCIDDMDWYVKRWIIEGGNPKDFTQRIIEENPNCIIVLQEVGSGIVPMEPSMRKERELIGRVGQQLARESDQVYRISCGIPMMIKGEAL